MSESGVPIVWRDRDEMLAVNGTHREVAQADIERAAALGEPERSRLLEMYRDLVGADRWDRWLAINRAIARLPRVPDLWWSYDQEMFARRIAAEVMT